MKTEIEWHNLPELPDDETAVLVAHGAGEVAEAYHAGKSWRGAGLDSLEIRGVYAWAHLPEAPARKP